MQWYLKVIKNYVGFSGRARRKEFWMFTLFDLFFFFLLSIIETLLELPTILSTLYSLAVLLPSLAVAVRRLHDTGKSGWWVLISFIPVVGAFMLIVFFTQNSDDERNQYGPNPKL